MKQMKIEKDKIIPLNYGAKGLANAIRSLKPIVYKENNRYHCHWGPDLKNGILGIGKTPMHALKDWLRNLDSRIRSFVETDEVVKNILAILGPQAGLA